MKGLIIVLIICMMLLAGCDSNNAPSSKDSSSTGASSGDIVVIKEKLFIAQLNDIYLNKDSYLGKTIKLEGMFTKYTWDEKDLTYFLVYRNSPGCCGADGQAGFEVIWSDDSNQTYPNENDWVEAVGVLEEYEQDGYPYLRIVLSSLNILTKRGVEFVSE